ncbi:hypothetical protein [Actinopolyspora mortivallis]|uniref:hypothetical protein n=1 Tax=Actinopolyspora mortivallis TaxID=33906 RepID=UPI0003A76636|nr:hypothetical protein [Actinopolyspora mortivallis]
MGLVAGILAWTPVDVPELLAHAAGTLVASGLFRPPGLVTLASAGLLAALATSHLRTRLRRRDRGNSTPEPSDAPVRPIPGWAIWLGLALLLTVGVTAAALLVWAFGGGSERDKVRLDAIKLAGSIAVGTGGTAALVLAARKQRATEWGLLQQEQAQRLQEQKAAQSKHDADERRVIELYTSVAQQLASEQAPVRMVGLYALSRLGQNNPDHRQAIVNLFCAYLRMPYTPSEIERSAPERDDYAHRSDPRGPGRARRDLRRWPHCSNSPPRPAPGGQSTHRHRVPAAGTAGSSDRPTSADPTPTASSGRTRPTDQRGVLGRYGPRSGRSGPRSLGLPRLPCTRCRLHPRPLPRGHLVRRAAVRLLVTPRTVGSERGLACRLAGARGREFPRPRVSVEVP